MERDEHGAVVRLVWTGWEPPSRVKVCGCRLEYDGTTAMYCTACKLAQWTATMQGAETP